MSGDRIPVTRERALAAAIDLADDEGLDAVSMRNLAARLGVTPMALYKHVAGKNELLDAMVDTVVAGYQGAAPGSGAPPESRAAAEDWQAAMRARILAARRALVVHPWLHALIETRTTRTPHVLAHMDALSGILIEGGLSVDLAHYAMHALGHRIWGFSPEAFSTPETGLAPVDPTQQQEMMAAMARAYPHVVAIATDAATRNASGACDEQDEFEFTLDLLLDAFARLHAAGWSSSGR